MRQQFAAALDLIVQVSRLPGGPRRVTAITEVLNLEQDVVVMQDLFVYRQLGVDQAGKAFGQFESTGVRPGFVELLKAAGVHLPEGMFQQRVLLRDAT